MQEKKLTPIKAIRQKCLECCAGQLIEVRLCNINKCSLWGYRMGHRPKDGKAADGEENTVDSIKN